MAKSSYIEDYVNTRFKILLEDMNFGRVEFLDSFYKRLNELKKEGLDDDSIVKILFDDLIKNKELAKLKNKENNNLWDFFKSTSQHTVWDGLDDATEYVWVMTEGANHCDGCVERNGQIKTFEEWEAEGLPGSGCTNCYYNCLCDLVPVEKDIAKDNPIENTTNESAEEKPLQNNKDFIKLIREELNVSISGKTDRLLEKSQERVYNGIKKAIEKTTPDLLDDFSNIKIAKLKTNARATYNDVTKEAELNLKSFDKDVIHKPRILGKKGSGNFDEKGREIAVVIYGESNEERIEGTTVHELGHYVYCKYKIVRDNAEKFYQDNKEAIKTYYSKTYPNEPNRVDHYTKKSSEFFSETFSRYCTEKLSESNDIPEIKTETELIRNFIKGIATKLKEGKK